MLQQEEILSVQEPESLEKRYELELEIFGSNSVTLDMQRGDPLL